MHFWNNSSEIDDYTGNYANRSNGAAGDFNSLQQNGWVIYKK